MYCKSIQNITTFSRIAPILGSDISLNNERQEGISITIDDGPSNYVLAMLKLFRRENIHASFFVLANKIERNPSLIHKIMADGHDICVHGLDHRIITQLSLADFRQSLADFDSIAKKHNIRYKKIFRPPNGEIDLPQVSLLQDLGFKVALWSLDSFDWKLTSHQINAHFRSQENLFHVTLFHDDVLGGSPFVSLKSLVMLVKLCRERNIPIVPMAL